MTFSLMAQTAVLPAGEGTEASPYLIANWQNLYWISQNSSSWDKHFIQTADINLTSTTPEITTWDSNHGWSPIEDDESQFTGIYDGDGHIISGLYINRSETNNQGLFGYSATGAEIKNIGLTDIRITGSTCVGGLVGNNNGNISNCYSTGTVSGIDNVGGLVGNNNGNISNCYSTGTVSGTNYVGGLVGNASTGLINNCLSIVTVSGNNNVGGLAGYIYFASIENCYSTGNVVGNSNVGGLAGYLLMGSISKCYSTGTVVGNSNVGGLLGFRHSYGTTSDSYYDKNTSGMSDTGKGTGKTTAEMKTQSTFTNWEFVTVPVWKIDTHNNGYPYLSWQTFDNPTLPVTLSSFTAVYNASNTVSINWQTESENNMIGYYIFRSGNNNMSDAERVSNLLTAYNQPETQNYSFTDTEVDYETTYYYWLQSCDLDGSQVYHGSICVTTGNGQTIQNPVIPINTVLKSAYPNPFNPSTTLSFDLASLETVKIDIFNAKGQLVKNLTHTVYSAGSHAVIWDGRDHDGHNCGTGVYYYRMVAGNSIQTRKMMMIK